MTRIGFRLLRAAIPLAGFLFALDGSARAADAIPAQKCDWLNGTYWYVPQATLPALLAVNQGTPVVRQVADQTVWFFERCAKGYLTGVSATNIGEGWSYMLIVGSIAPGGAVKLSFSPLASVGEKSASPGDDALTIGDGRLIQTGRDGLFVMQMTSGSAAANLTHWSYMRNVTPAAPAWTSLPGYPKTGVKDLTGLLTPIRTQ